jgi:hypothetical protein
MEQIVETNPPVLVTVQRIREKDGLSVGQRWCLDCIRGKSPVKEYPKY